MCDFSLQHAKSRPAVVADKLVTKDFGRGTIGFCSVDDVNATEPTAVCVMPGTEIAFDEAVQERFAGWLGATNKVYEHKVARFRQIDKDTVMAHHDALELPDGTIIKLTMIKTGMTATVLQLPAAPKNEAEAKEQTRLEVVG
jgi:hypothetical protein